jgi:hypothetical protein
MIKVLENGVYKLIETKRQIKVLYLGDKTYVWLYIPGIGHILEITHTAHSSDHVLAWGEYRLYEVKNDARFSDQMHLELCVGKGQWQGYLLLSGLPTNTKKKGRMVATQEVISFSVNEYHVGGVE